MPDKSPAPPVFFDIEASGLGGVPIEVGWAIPDPTSGSIETHAVLIRPDPKWQIEAHWDDAAELLHGITLVELRARGLAPADVANRMNEALAGRELYSDAPGFDRHWLQMVFDAEDSRQCFTVSTTEVHTFIGTAARNLGWSPAKCRLIMAQVMDDNPRTHRAADDARLLAALWLAMTKES